MEKANKEVSNQLFYTKRCHEQSVNQMCVDNSRMKTINPEVTAGGRTVCGESSGCAENTGFLTQNFFISFLMYSWHLL